MTTKKKIIKEEEDGYNFCGEDDMSEGYTKNIPTIKAGISVVEFAVKEVSLKSVPAIKNNLIRILFKNKAGKLTKQGRQWYV